MEGGRRLPLRDHDISPLEPNQWSAPHEGILPLAWRALWIQNHWSMPKVDSSEAFTFQRQSLRMNLEAFLVSINRARGQQWKWCFTSDFPSKTAVSLKAVNDILKQWELWNRMFAYFITSALLGIKICSFLGNTIPGDGIRQTSSAGTLPAQSVRQWMSGDQWRIHMMLTYGNFQFAAP